MKLRDLGYLLALSKTLHFGKAAELCHVSQPTLSVQLKKLEDRLGLALVERNNKHVRLTPAGTIIAQKAAQIFSEIDSIKTYAATQKDPLAGDVQLGIIPTLGPYLLPKIIPGLHKQLPKALLWLQEKQTHVILADLQHGDLDVAILSPPINDESLTIIPLIKEPFLLAVHPEHPLAKKKSINLKDIETEKILLLEDGHCFKDQAMDLCTRAAAEPLKFRATSLETLRHMVAENLGSTLIPLFATHRSTSDVVYIPFKKPAPLRQLALVFRKTHVQAPLFKEMAKVIKILLQSDKLVSAEPHR